MGGCPVVHQVPSKCSKDWVDRTPTQRWASFLPSAQRTGCPLVDQVPSKCSKDSVHGASTQSWASKGLGVRRSTRFIRSARRTRSMGVDTTLGEFPSKCSKDRVGVRRLVLDRTSTQRWASFLRSVEGMGGCPVVDQVPSKCSKDWVDRTPTQRWASFLPSARRTGWVSGGRPVSFEVLEGLGRSNADTTLGEFPSKCSKDWVGVRRSTSFLRSARRNSVDRTSTQRWASFHRSARRNGWVSGRRPGSFEVLEGLRRSNVDTTLDEFPSKCS